MQILRNSDFENLPVNEQSSTVNLLSANTITQSNSPEQEDVTPRRESEPMLATASPSASINLQTDESKVNDNSTQDNKNTGSDSDATVEYTPPPNSPNPDTTDETTPKGSFYNKLCGIKKGKKK